MKLNQFFSITLLAGLLSLSISWETDFDKAKEKAKDQHRYILLNFSGSDWCGPCIRMRKQVFEAAEFTSYAESNLVLVNADFPRMAKNQLSKDQQKKNDKLADKYNPQGNFPVSLLLDEEGKVLKSWEGYGGMSAADFTAQIKAVVDARK